MLAALATDPARTTKLYRDEAAPCTFPLQGSGMNGAQWPSACAGSWHGKACRDDGGVFLQDVVFYQLPEHAGYYNELLQMMADGPRGTQQLGHATSTSIFSRFDSLALQQICGSKRAKRMLRSDSAAFMFC